MTSRPAQRRYLPGSPFNRTEPAPAVEQFDVSDRVTHDKYGLGRVTRADEAGVIVDFGSERVRIASPFSKLTKL